MARQEMIMRYNLIIKKLRNRHATFREIAGYLDLESEIQGRDFSVSKRTFHRVLEDIRTIYNIDIQFDRHQMAYYIHTDEHAAVSERILEAFDLFNSLNLSDRLSNHIHFEIRQPQGTENLHGLLHAIQSKVQVIFNYQKFVDEHPEERNVEPYALKEAKYRWYVIGLDSKDRTVKSFALDRLTQLEITKKKFRHPQEFDVAEHYKHSFGIIGPGRESPAEVVLSFEPLQGKFIKTLPLHPTQEILVDDEKELRVKLKLYLTYDFIMEILSMGRDVKVLKPARLTRKITEILHAALSQYEN